MKHLFCTILALIAAIGSVLGATPYTVTSNTLNVRATPSAQGKLVGTLARGTEIQVEEINSGFAAFDFLGKRCYASAKFLKNNTPEPAVEKTRPAPKAETPSPAPVSKAHATVYIFYDTKHYYKAFPIDINGRRACTMEGKPIKGGRFDPAMRKINITGEGKAVLSYDVTWADKPFHDALNFDIEDGGVYYVKLYFDNIFNAVKNKRTNWQIRLLTQKEGLKCLADTKKYTQNPEVDFTL